jgi:hypothetical protein
MTMWKHLFGRGCSHRFAWPRVDDDGRHYQICLLCGTAYEYDWTTMCRTDRLMAVNVTQVSQAKGLSGPGSPLAK